MKKSRRRFLGLSGISLASLAAMLSPQEAFAFFGRRRRGTPCPPRMMGSPVCPTPTVIRPAVCAPPQRQRWAVGSINIYYPYTHDPVLVVYTRQGLFFAWGYSAQTSSLVGTVTWSGGSASGVPHYSSDGTGYWSMRFLLPVDALSGGGTNVDLALSISGTDTNIPPGAVSPQTIPQFRATLQM